jgi:hypothetical protein
LECEFRKWSRWESTAPTDQAWRAGVAEGLRLAQAAIRKRRATWWRFTAAGEPAGALCKDGEFWAGSCS